MVRRVKAAIRRLDQFCVWVLLYRLGNEAQALAGLMNSMRDFDAPLEASL
jgi:hypothetical protein